MLTASLAFFPGTVYLLSWQTGKELKTCILHASQGLSRLSA